MVSSDQRRRQLAREKFARQQERRESARSKARRRNAIIATTLVVVLAASGGAVAAGAFKSEEPKDPASAPEPSSSPSSSPEPKMAIDKKAKYTFGLETSQGDIAIAMDAAKTPHTVNSFKHLADKGFFDKTKCHRLTTQGIFVLQCGDPEGTGAGGPGYTLPDEDLKSLGKPGKDGAVTYPAGTVAMANTGQPHTGGSQFFLVYKDSKLPPQYTAFGKMDDKGLKAVKDVADAGVGKGGQAPTDGPPKKAVTVEKATVKKD
ncbi:peptidylprolyl isomerase [Streptomyces monticola]|uniref:Peptidylprolyl isomerase n=1 Tax=Streptomyces monticola TaxID=2666263 RepID=A0ABW2JNH6_9ACTN